ncbi:hypothetical protein DID88_000728 [Monilinia fructigena]|uniref:Uncharacterized protein n=1 Tax=Monilinia fructigena TaxID=38457 RepID=A0A395IL54_9HELO|nr:hypothetical protein DID88_000728 [Monilinia fructigena]
MYHHTPESLLPRTDSKNPNSTCRGLSSNGKPCRRGLSKSPNNSPSPSPSRGALSPEAFCWQHKDQAGQAALPVQSRPNPLRERSSVDTLVERLGLLDVDPKKVKGNNVKQQKIIVADDQAQIQLQKMINSKHNHIGCKSITRLHILKMMVGEDIS